MAIINAGDSALTAAHVAKDVGMCTAPVILAEVTETGDSLVWRMPDDTLSPFKAQELPRLVSDFTLGLTGSAIQTLSDQGLLASVVPYCQVGWAVDVFPRVLGTLCTMLYALGLTPPFTATGLRSGKPGAKVGRGQRILQQGPLYDHVWRRHK
jgi:cytochrome c biogenesis protein CcdA